MLQMGLGLGWPNRGALDTELKKASSQVCRPLPLLA